MIYSPSIQNNSPKHCSRNKTNAPNRSDADASAEYLGEVVNHELSAEQLLSPNPIIRITDDRPLNEYFLLRHLGSF